MIPTKDKCCSRQEIQFKKFWSPEIISSSIPDRSKQVDVKSLTISSQTLVVSEGRKKKNTLYLRDDVHSSFPGSSQPRKINTRFSQVYDSQEIEGCAIENHHQTQKEKGDVVKTSESDTFKTSESDAVDLTQRSNSVIGETDSSTTSTSRSEKDDAYTILTSRPTTSLSIPSLPDTEGPDSHCSLRKKDDNFVRSSNVSGSRPGSSLDLSTYQNQAQNPDQLPTRMQSARPTWPSLIDIQRLRSGGFRYRFSMAKSRESGEETHIENQPPESSDHGASCQTQIVKKKSGSRRMGAIIVPSHTMVDCPLCNLYAREQSDSYERNLTVYQHPNQMKETTGLSSSTTSNRKSLSGSISKNRLTATVVNISKSKPTNVVKYRQLKTSMKIPVSQREETPCHNNMKYNAQVPVAVVYEKPRKFSYVKAPSNLNEQENWFSKCHLRIGINLHQGLGVSPLL